MTKTKAISLKQKKNLLDLLQFLIKYLLLLQLNFSTRIFANAFIILLIYRTIKFNLKPVSSQLFEKFLLHATEILEDTNRYVVFHESVCHLLHLNNFDWVLVSFRVNSDAKNCTVSVKKYFQVISSTAVQPLDIIVTNDTSVSVLNQLNTLEVQTNLKVKFVRKVPSFAPKTAKKTTIQLLEKFHNPNPKLIDDILYSYFSYPRFLRENDVFSVSAQRYFPEQFYAIKHFSTSDIQCKVVNIFGESDHSDIAGYLVTNCDTSLIQLNNYQGFLAVEKCQENVSGTVASNSLKRKLCSAQSCLHPKGFDQYFSQILSWCNIFIEYNQNDLHLLPFFLISGADGSGKSMLVKNAARSLGLQYFQTDCTFLQTTTPGYADAQLKNLFLKLKKCAPCLVHFSHFEALCINSSGIKDDRLVSSLADHLNELKSEWPILIFATAQNPSEISGTIARLFLESLELELLSQSQRKSVLLWAAQQQCLDVDATCLEYLSKLTTGFLFSDLVNLVDQAILKFQENLPSIVDTLTSDHFDEAFKKIQAAHASSIGSPQIPAVLWDDVGGLGSLKQEILISLSTMPSSNSLRRSGLLLHGPPGTGKTLIAKAIATECNFHFLSIKGPELLNMYVGQSEQNVREVFARARSASPCVVFFDELDSLAPNRGKNGDSGGVMDRVVSQLLAEMDEVQKSEGIFVLAATNRPDLIDPALLRPGRLDKLLYVGPCEDKESKLHVLKAVTRKYNLSEDININDIANDLSGKVTGADISAICSSAWLNAARRLIAQHESEGEGPKPPLNKRVTVGKDDFLLSIKAVR